MRVILWTALVLQLSFDVWAGWRLWPRKFEPMENWHLQTTGGVAARIESATGRVEVYDPSVGDWKRVGDNKAAAK